MEGDTELVRVEGTKKEKEKTLREKTGKKRREGRI